MKTDHAEGKINRKAPRSTVSGIRDLETLGKLKITKPVPATKAVDPFIVVVIMIHCWVVFLLTPWLSDTF